MANEWRILDLSTFEGRLSSERGAVEVIPKDGAPTRIPVADLAVVLLGIKVGLSAAVLHRFASADVAVLFCDWRGIPEGAAYSWSNNGRVGARHRAQSALTVPRQKNAWGRTVAAKIRGQAATSVALNLTCAAELKAMASQVKSGDPGNCEAQAARLFWGHALPPGDRRAPGAGGLLGPNACLDYGYTILRGHAIRAVLAAGLNPALGVFHHGRGNAFALVDDLIEPFRPCIDEVALRFGQTSTPSDPEVKRALVEAASRPFDPSGITIPTALMEFAQHYAGYCELSVDRLKVPTWVGPLENGGMEGHGR